MPEDVGGAPEDVVEGAPKDVRKVVGWRGCELYVYSPRIIRYPGKATLVLKPTPGVVVI